MVIFPIQVTRLRTPKLLNCCHQLIQKANLTSRGTRGGPLKLQKPFPYEKKQFYWYHRLFDKTMLRVGEENARIIVVEGPIGVGKTAFAKALAEEFDMYHIEEVNLDKFYILPSGYDIRQHMEEMPKLLQYYGHVGFCKDPTDLRAIRFQYDQYYYRFHQYVNALAHIFNTGQGVVLERSFFSDYVFATAMYRNNFFTKNAMNVYNTVKKNTSTFFMPPHLVIYLDIPVPVVQERIRTRNYSYEQNSPALTKKYLEDLEDLWKNDYLKKAEKYSEVLVYDWTEGGDIELICEDIENIDFNILRDDEKFRNWALTRQQLHWMRTLVTNTPEEYNQFFYYPISDLPEFYHDYYSYATVCNRLAKVVPDCKYAEGYNMELGDKFFNILFKTNTENHRRLKYYMQWKHM